MNFNTKELECEIKELKKWLEQAKKRLQTAPKGNVNIKVKRGKAEYYYKGENDKHNGRYLKKSEHKLAKELIQRDYDKKFLKLASERIKMLEVIREKDEKNSLKKLYEKTNPFRTVMIKTPIISDEEYVKRWKEVEYKGKEFDENMPEIYTDRGERVRSKSEKIIADKLNAMGIPYKYECPLILNGNTKIHPDFTILKMPERKEVYLEHLGMMDDADYISGFLWKLGMYEKNKIYLGVNLFFTYETGSKPLNTRVLPELFKEIFVG